jgi:hypothetical protein
MPAPVLAGFLEMPEITEVPGLERKSLLKDLDIPGVSASVSRWYCMRTTAAR